MLCRRLGGLVKRTLASSGHSSDLQKPAPSSAPRVHGAAPTAHSSIASSLFVNRVDVEHLVYPEFEETDDLTETNKLANSVKSLFSAITNSAQLETSQRISDVLLRGCRERGLYAMNIPVKFGGLGLSQKAITKLYAQLSEDLSLFMSVWMQNEAFSRAISVLGSDQQMVSYLPRLAKGTLSGAICVREEQSGDDMASIQTRAVLTDAGGVCISGVKHWVVNGASADTLLVIAKYDSGEESSGTLSAFLVDRGSCPGIQIVKKHNTIGLRALEMVDLRFDNVTVPLSCMLSSPGNGFQVAHLIRHSGGHHFSAMAAALLKRLLNVSTSYCNRTKQFGITLAESGFIKERLAALSLDIFTLETVSYYIAGYMDDQPDRGYDTESSIALLYARRALRAGITSVMEILGASSCTDDMEVERLFRDVTMLCSILNSDDWLIGQIAMSGLVTWAKEMSIELHKGSRPYLYPWHVAKNVILKNDLYADSFSLKHYLNEHVHPSLTDACRFIEEVMCKFEHIIRGQLLYKGKAIEEDAFALQRLCSVASSIFLMLTAVSRASRSYCIGLKNGELEVYMAHALCGLLKKNSSHLMTELIYGGAYGMHNEDLMRNRIAEAVASHNGYPIVSPLEKNCDPAMKQFLLHLEETNAVGFKFILRDLDETHLFISSDAVTILSQKIDSFMEALCPDIAEK